MSDIEQRKAAAYKFMHDWREELGQMEQNDNMHGVCSFILELLKPSPQVADHHICHTHNSPITRKDGIPVYKCIECDDKIIDGLEYAYREMWDAVNRKLPWATIEERHEHMVFNFRKLRAAQHPQREEWRTMDTCPADTHGKSLIFTDGKKRWFDTIPPAFDKEMSAWIGEESFNKPTHWTDTQPLPSPPKAEK